MYFTVFPLCGPGSIPSSNGLFQGIFPHLSTRFHARYISFKRPSFWPGYWLPRALALCLGSRPSLQAIAAMAQAESMLVGNWQ